MSSYNQLLSARILSEANDLKRNIPALAKDLKMDLNELKTILENGSLEEIHQVIHKMAQVYPIDIGDLLIPKSDTQWGVKIMTLEDSQASSRVFDRKNALGESTPYYEYRDTALSVNAPFKPEWIKQIRFVENDDPSHPDVQYNNGHFLHQVTFFVGPVNFYWEQNGKKYCAQMNTGDSNYITPFVPHSFTNRSKDEEAYIVAVTFGGEVRRAQKALYAMGDRVLKSTLNVQSSYESFRALLNQHLRNEWVSLEAFSSFCQQNEIPWQEGQIPETNHLAKIANFLNVDVTDLSVPAFDLNSEVVVKHGFEDDGYEYPQSKDAFYKIKPLARTSHLKNIKGFDVECLSSMPSQEGMIQSSGHSYVFNYGDKPITLQVQEKGQTREWTLRPSDSAYIQPFVEHLFYAKDKGAKSFVERMSGAYNLATQKELSYFKDKKRAIQETSSWYNYD